VITPENLNQLKKIKQRLEDTKNLFVAINTILEDVTLRDSVHKLIDAKDLLENAWIKKNLTDINL